MTVIPIRASCPSAECSVLLNQGGGAGKGHRSHPPRVQGHQKNYIQFQRAYVSQLSPNSHTVQDGGMHLYRWLTIAEILRASSRPGRCDENFCDGSFCGASFCSLSLIFSFVHTIQQRSSQSNRFAIGRYTYRYTCIFICIHIYIQICVY